MPFCSLNRPSLFKVHESHTLFPMPQTASFLLLNHQTLRVASQKGPPPAPGWRWVSLLASIPVPLVPSVGSLKFVISYFYRFVYMFTGCLPSRTSALKVGTLLAYFASMCPVCLPWHLANYRNSNILQSELMILLLCTFQQLFLLFRNSCFCVPVPICTRLHYWILSLIPNAFLLIHFGNSGYIVIAFANINSAISSFSKVIQLSCLIALATYTSLF